MLRLKAIIIATIIAAPVMIKAAEFTPFASADHKYYLYMSKAIVNDADPKWDVENSFYQSKGDNFSGKIGLNFSADRVSGQVKLGTSLTGVSTSDWYVQYTITDEIFFKIGKYGSPFGTPGGRGTSGPDVNLMMGIKGLKLSIAPNDKVTVALDQNIQAMTKNAAGVLEANVAYETYWLPKLALAYEYSNDLIKVGGATCLNVIQQYFDDAKTEEKDTVSMTFMGWAASGQLSFTFGNFKIQLAGLYAINGNLAGVNPNGNGTDKPKVNVLEDGTVKGYTIIEVPVSVSVTLTDKVSAEAGLSAYLEKESVEEAVEYTGQKIYANITIKDVLPGLKLVPDFSYEMKKSSDGKNDLTKINKNVKIGVKSGWSF